MPWNGQKDCLIDRFDVRATLDHIPVVQKQETEPELTSEERNLNYERYRILAQNEFLGIHEEKYLHQLYLEEQFGVNAQYEIEKTSKKKGSQAGAAIGYTYEENDATLTPFSQTISSIEATRFDEDFSKDDSADSDVDMDVSIDITKIQTSQAHELNSCGRHFGMVSNDFYSFLTKDYDEAESLKLAREEEAEKILLVGRKSRRERRAQREKKYLGRPPLSPPSYAAKEDKPVKESFVESRSPSRSPENSGKITYITSFGGEDELQAHSKISITLNKTNKGAGSSMDSHLSSQMSYAEKVRENLDKLKKINEVERVKDVKVRSRSHSRSRSRSRRSRDRRRRSRSHRRKRYSSSTSPKRHSRTRLRKKSSSSSSSSSPSPPPQRPKTKSPSSSSSSSSTTIASPEKMEVDEELAPEPPIVKKYYGRKRDGDSSSEVSFDEDEGENKVASNERSVGYL